MTPLIELKSVSKIYGANAGNFVALKDVDLCIDAGDFVSIAGPSGSGKSTCLNILGCLDAPTFGQYLLQGEDVGAIDERKRALLRRHLMGFVFQSFNLLKRTTALENVELPLIYRKYSSPIRRKLALEALDSVGLIRWRNHLTSEMSGGQQQRVAIARAVVTKPTIIFADEPTGNLDSFYGREILDLLKQFNVCWGITVVVVTHDRRMDDFSNRAIEFCDGVATQATGMEGRR